MERSLLKVGDEVAVYLGHPVPRDPYASHHRQGVRKGTVDSTSGREGVGIDWSSNVQYVESRQIITYWDRWEERLARRDEASSGQRTAQLERLNAEADALTSVQAIFPGATVSNGSVVIPIAAWLTHREELA